MTDQLIKLNHVLEETSLYTKIFTYTRAIYRYIFSGYNNHDCCQTHRKASRC